MWFDKLAEILSLVVADVRASHWVPVVASVRLQQLQGWFDSWAPKNVYRAGGGRSAVEVWYFNCLEYCGVFVWST